MAVETLTANTLVADSGTVLSFSGGTFDIADLRDENNSTGLTIGSNDAFIDFSISIGKYYIFVCIATNRTK